MKEELGAVSADGESVRRFLASRFLFDPDAEIDPRASLLGEGVLDSTGAMDLVLFVEEEFGVGFADEELIPANLDSIERVVAFIARKRTAASEASGTGRTQPMDVGRNTPNAGESRATHR
ncbi:MAG: acyl carrier protein [Planctomycetaceae bacterium]|jgi:acyl carrier protein|nr:acyl carrier protein [Planctomycetaceae bacterium]